MVSTTRWVGMSENMSVCLILETNGWRPCVVGTECSAALKIMTNPLFKITLIYRKYMSFAKVFIK